MGSTVVKAVFEDTELELVGAVDKTAVGVDAGLMAAVSATGVAIVDSISAASSADVMVDFTLPSMVEANVLEALGAGMHVVVGTTGLTETQLSNIEKKSADAGHNVFVAPNFAIGAVLMMELAKKAAKHMDNVEIIELHHDQKADAPSGTALKTASELDCKSAVIDGEKETVSGARGGVQNDIRIHSVRLPGLVAHQEVLFGAKGQTLSIRHDSIDRVSFMPGVITAIKAVPNLKGLTIGLEKILEI